MRVVTRCALSVCIHICLRCILCYCSRLSCQTPLGNLIQSINGSFCSLIVLLIWEAVVIRVQCENNSIVSQVLEKFLMFSEPQLGLHLLILLCHWASNIHSWSYPSLLPSKTVWRRTSASRPHELLPCLFMVFFLCIVAYLKATNSEPYLPSRFFCIKKAQCDMCY